MNNIAAHKHWLLTFTGWVLGFLGWMATNWKPIIGGATLILGLVATICSIRASRATERARNEESALARERRARERDTPPHHPV